MSDTFQIVDISHKTLSIQHNLARIGPLVRTTRYLALNAKFAVENMDLRGGPFSTLVTELNAIVGDLDELLADVAHSSWEMARSAAACSNYLHRIALLVRALVLTTERSWPKAAAMCRDLLDGKDWIRESRYERARLTAAFRPRTPEAVLWATMMRLRLLFVLELRALVDHTRALSALANKINWVAVQQINLVAVTALVEAAWSGFDATNIPALAGDIRTLAAAITEVEHVATNQLLDLEARLHRLERPARDYLKVSGANERIHDQSSVI